jgi:3-deoxy-D-manno-octulosonic acid kinase
MRNEPVVIPESLRKRITVDDRGGLVFLARRDLLDAVREEELDDPSRWNALLGDATVAAGRGTTARLRLSGGTRVVLKALRRGGLTSFLWRDHFPGARRLIDNLVIPLEAIRRGVATPAPVALLIERRPAGLCRGWLAIEEIAGAIDLLTWLREGRPPEAAGEAMRAVRTLHDAGVNHLDLNLGNLLLRPGTGDRVEAFVIDLDRAELSDCPLPFAPRSSGLRRVERSYVKNFGYGGPLAPDAGERLDSLYAGNDTDLSRRLDAARPIGQFWIWVHALRWRKRT